jgi:hypothetical protein
VKFCNDIDYSKALALFRSLGLPCQECQPKLNAMSNPAAISLALSQQEPTITQPYGQILINSAFVSQGMTDEGILRTPLNSSRSNSSFSHSFLGKSVSRSSNGTPMTERSENVGLSERPSTIWNATSMIPIISAQTRVSLPFKPAPFGVSSSSSFSSSQVNDQVCYIPPL